MQISSKFTIGVHLLAVMDYLGEDEKATSTVLASKYRCKSRHRQKRHEKPQRGGAYKHQPGQKRDIFNKNS